MASETITVKTEELAAAPEASAAGSGATAGKREWACPMGDRHVHKDDLKKVWKECQDESFWYRALPLSLGSMAGTYGLIHQGIWKSSQRFGPFPKLVVAGILGFAVGKASYVGTCREKFKELGLKGGPGFGPWSDGGRPGPWKSGPGHRPCHHVCEECKKKSEAAPAEPQKA